MRQNGYAKVVVISLFFVIGAALFLSVARAGKKSNYQKLIDKLNFISIKKIFENFGIDENEITNTKNNLVKISWEETNKPSQLREDFICATGAVVAKEDATAKNSALIQKNINEIKETLGIDIVFQLFEEESNQNDWIAFFEEAKKQNIKVLVALTNAGGYIPECPSETECNLGPERAFLETVAQHPTLFEDTLFGVLLVDEPLEDSINSLQMQSLYSKAKVIADVPLAVGWGRQIYKAESSAKASLKFSNGMCDICIISALESRDYGSGPILDIETLRKNHQVSRRVIRERDPDAKIVSSVQAFGNVKGKNYVMPTLEEFQSLINIVLFDEELNNAGVLEGIIFQSWKAPTRVKEQNQLNLSNPRFETHQKVVEELCYKN